MSAAHYDGPERRRGISNEEIFDTISELAEDIKGIKLCQDKMDTSVNSIKIALFGPESDPEMGRMGDTEIGLVSKIKDHEDCIYGDNTADNPGLIKQYAGLKILVGVCIIVVVGFIGLVGYFQTEFHIFGSPVGVSEQYKFTVSDIDSATTKPINQSTLKN